MHQAQALRADGDPGQDLDDYGRHEPARDGLAAAVQRTPPRRARAAPRTEPSPCHPPAASYPRHRTAKPGGRADRGRSGGIAVQRRYSRSGPRVTSLIPGARMMRRAGRSVVPAVGHPRSSPTRVTPKTVSRGTPRSAEGGHRRPPLHEDLAACSATLVPATAAGVVCCRPVRAGRPRCASRAQAPRQRGQHTAAPAARPASRPLPPPRRRRAKRSKPQPRGGHRKGHRAQRSATATPARQRADEHGRYSRSRRVCPRSSSAWLARERRQPDRVVGWHVRHPAVDLGPARLLRHRRPGVGRPAEGRVPAAVRRVRGPAVGAVGRLLGQPQPANGPGPVR